MLLSEAYYIDTRPGFSGLFSPPDNVDNYSDWLLACYKRSAGNKDKYAYGVGQQVLVLLQKQKRCKLEILAHGPYAGEAAEVLAEITNDRLCIEVIG